MTTREAWRLITRTFEQPYDEATVRQFVQNLLVGAEMKHRGHRKKAYARSLLLPGRAHPHARASVRGARTAGIQPHA